MKIEGLLIDNMQAAVASARRLSGHPVYRDTQVYWTELLALARAERVSQSPSDQAHLDMLILKLGQELAERGAF